MTVKELREKLNAITDDKILNMDIMLEVNNTLVEDIIMDFVFEDISDNKSEDLEELYSLLRQFSVLGVCDYEHLKENVEKIWNESRENEEENDVVVYGVEKINAVGYDELITSYYFDKYDEGTKLGLRLIGLGGAIDIPLEIEV